MHLAEALLQIAEKLCQDILKYMIRKSHENMPAEIIFDNRPLVPIGNTNQTMLKLLQKAVEVEKKQGRY